ncbi:MAG: hypothetical protein KJO35_00845 [Gammaproteobacteria bacterium]|nr:hypothetical protein [Gammaproteobacteria bacterium]NNF67262.1 hypothetical protein [Gammaproteobacteria bacterium]
MKSLSWLLRREIWESRSLYLVPLVFIVLFLLLYTFGLLAHGPNGLIKIDAGEGIVHLQDLIKDEPEAQQAIKLAAGGLPFILPAVLLNAVMLFIWFFYLTDALYTERKDRSVFFWKSLPLSDTMTVLSKLLTAAVVIPVITLCLIAFGALWMSLANSIFAWTIDESAWHLVWSQMPFLSGPATIVYALAVQSLWFAPVFAWLLLASAWARRAPALWATLPLVGVYLLEGAVFRTTHFGQLVGDRLTSVVPTAFHDTEIERVIGNIQQSDGKIEWAEAFGSLIDPGSFLTSSGMWAGLIVAAIFLSGAIWLRRYRSDI